MKMIAIIQARMSSSRLPGKVLKEIAQGTTVLSYLIQRLKKSKRIDEIIVATSTNIENAPLEHECLKLEINCFRGDENDVLDRYYQCAKKFAHNNDYLLRITGDCPLIDPNIIDDVIDFTIKNELDFCNNSMVSTFPDGMDVAVINFNTLTKAWENASVPSEREHVTPYIIKNSTFKGGDLFKSDCFTTAINHSTLRLTLDEKEDLELIKKLVNQFTLNSTYTDYVSFLKSHPGIAKINTKYKRNEGYDKSLKLDLKNDQ